MRPAPSSCRNGLQHQFAEPNVRVEKVWPPRVMRAKTPRHRVPGPSGCRVVNRQAATVAESLLSSVRSIFARQGTPSLPEDDERPLRDPIENVPKEFRKKPRSQALIPSHVGTPPACFRCQLRVFRGPRLLQLLHGLQNQ